MYRINKDGDSEEKGSYFIRKDSHATPVAITITEPSFIATAAGMRLSMRDTTTRRSTAMTPCATAGNRES